MILALTFTSVTIDAENASSDIIRFGQSMFIVFMEQLLNIDEPIYSNSLGKLIFWI